MKKKWLAVLLMLVLSLTLAACGNKDGGSASESGESPSSKGGAVKVGEEISLENGIIIGTVEDVVFLDDISGNPAIKVKYNVTNQSEKERSVIEMFVIRAVQDGQDLDIAILEEEDENSEEAEAAFTMVEPGKNSGTVISSYELNSDSDITLLITSIDDAFKGVQYTIEVPAPKG